MKKLLILALILLTILNTGCLIYGKGETTGYVYAVDDGIFWDKAWYKSSLDSSESDCYLLKDDNIKAQLRSLDAGTNVKLYYNRHFMTIAICPEGTSTEDEVYKFEIINK